MQEMQDDEEEYVLMPSGCERSSTFIWSQSDKFEILVT